METSSSIVLEDLPALLIAAAVFSFAFILLRILRRRGNRTLADSQQGSSERKGIPPDHPLPFAISSPLLTTVLNGLEEGVMVLDRAGTILFANDRAGEILSLPSASIGRRLGHLSVPFEILDLVKRVFETDQSETREFAFYYPEERFLKVSAQTLPMTGKEKTCLLIVTDRTQWKTMEKIHKDLITHISHEVKTPVSAIAALSEALMMGAAEDPELRDRFLKSLCEEANRLSRLMESLLELVRLDRGVVLSEKTRLSLRELAQEVLSSFAAAAQAKGLHLLNEVPADLTVETHQAALFQILRNLMDNAVKFTHQGYVRLFAGRDPRSPFVFICVEDTGIGIPPEDHERIFHRFYQGDRSRSGTERGFGLGLSIAKEWAERLGGRITVTSQPGQGSCFTVFLPAATNEERDQSHSPPPAPATVTPTQTETF
ncbi:MAG: PAS domain-containing sensor histidine kinase [Armatimonadetes bacterium]|nr:PAS domain-containing sensor histidine kinase [Armatimonadota bacterium]MDW8121914.1 PAS domain-containing sensor histidine kinase [Armatimonadota bacterium]